MDKPSRKALKEQYQNRKVVGGVYCIKCSGSDDVWFRSTTDMQGAKNRFLFSLSTDLCPEICMGYAFDNRMEKTFQHFLDTQYSDGGWRCNKFSFGHGMLGLLNYGPMTGYELDKAFKESLSFFWQAQTSQIYRELDAMEQNGWLSSEYVIQKDKPNKRVYSITDTGKKELNNWLLSPQSDIAATMRIKNAFLMGHLSF